MYQWAKDVATRTNGSRVFLPDGTWYYVTGDGREIEFKTIGGFCQVCHGTGINPEP